MKRFSRTAAPHLCQIKSLLALISLLLPGGSLLRAEDVSLPARELSARSSNIAAEYAAFDNLTLCVGKGGFMEWAIEVQGGAYSVHFYYCSGEPRPCQLSINGEDHPEVALQEPTGGFFSGDLRWQSHGPFNLVRGRNTIRIASSGFMPHLRGLTVSSSKIPPKKNLFRDPAAEAEEQLTELNIAGLRKAITDLGARYDYPGHEDHLARLTVLERELRTRPEAADEIEQLRTEALLSDNPLLQFDKLLFVKRHTYQSNHYYTDYINGCKHFGGNLCVLSLADGTVTELAPRLNGGIFGRCDLSFDGKRAVFGYKPRIGKGFRIWEVGLDGSGLRQITFDPPDEQSRIRKYRIDQAYHHHTDDMHPCYLPDGGICFVSTRCERGILCDTPDLFTTTTLYRMDADGRNLEVLSNGPLSEGSPSVMNDGRILYTRWEYVDKPDVVIKCLWAMFPDGSGSTEIYGNNITFPDTLLHGRAIPGSNSQFVVIGAPHMPLGVGTVIRIDTRQSGRTRPSMTYITPNVDVRTEHGYFHKRNGRWRRDYKGPLYTDPYPLDDKFFLVTCNPDREFNDLSAYGIYLLDEFGNRVLIHRDSSISCWQPIRAQPRKTPPVAISSRDSANTAATLIMSDVYVGLNGVERGTIKYLRVMETLARPWAARRFWDGDSSYQQHAVVSMNGSLHAKRMLGIVPVEADGSAHFTVPPDRNLYFQALDKDFMEVQRMRSFVNLRPGESRSCIGCHSPKKWTPRTWPMLALHHRPHELRPQPGDSGPRPIHYAVDVQPILDRHCVSCHNAEKLEGDLDLSGELTTLFNRSYENLLQKDLVQVFHENEPKTGDASPVPPYTLGSHVSKLVQLIREGHADVNLSRSEFIRLVTWIDANSPYYGSYFGRRNVKYRNHPDFRPTPK